MGSPDTGLPSHTIPLGILWEVFHWCIIKEFDIVMRNCLECGKKVVGRFGLLDRRGWFCSDGCFVDYFGCFGGGLYGG